MDIGEWVIRTACRQLAQWHQEGLPYVQVAVNISPIHFRQPEIVETVRNILEETALPAKYLELEVTESTIQTEGNMDIFQQVRALGVTIAIDDFGTGYSSLASLKQLPVDCLKIDRIFVMDLEANPHTSMLLGTIIGMANALNCSLVAEGIETKQQALILHGLGCRLVQGFYFSRPVAADDIPELMEKRFLPETQEPLVAEPV